MNKDALLQMVNRLTIVRSIILGFFFMSLYYFFLYDNGDNLQKANENAAKDIAATKQEIASTKNKLDRAHDYQKSTAEMGEALNRLLSYIPEEFRAQDFMKVLSEEAKVAGLNILRIDDGGSVIPDKDKGKKADFEELTVTVQLEGSFAQQMTFLSNLTRKKQIFVVDNFQMSRVGGNGPGESEFPVLSFRATVRAYRYIGGGKKT